MKHPKKLSILDFNYELPEERIAKYPLEKRDQSKLLVYRNKQISESVFSQISIEIPENALLIFNNTKVVEARILFQKPTGGKIEIFCLEPDDQYATIAHALQTKQSVTWKCMVGGASKWKQSILEVSETINGDAVTLKAEKVSVNGEIHHIRFSWLPEDLMFAEVLHLFGILPIPPYLKRETEASDTKQYQTVYAKEEGSVAAPTAGLHFTEEVFQSLLKKNIQSGFVTLHVGAGTFKPVKSQTMKDHEMHAEFIEVDKSLIQQLAHHNKKVFCVGTTSIRTIESLYWMGVKCMAEPALAASNIGLSQWEVYDDLPQDIPASNALQALLQWMEEQQLERLVTKTQIIIAPGYQCRLTEALITNFHQPQSTLLLLIASLVGENWSNIYRYALDNDFRFLSYGDSSLLFT